MERQRLEFLGELASGFAHEIKNPLSTLRLQLELMQEEFESERESELADRNKNRINLLLDEISRLQSIVNEFQEVSRGHDLKLQATPMEPFLQDLVALHRAQAERVGATIHCKFANALGDTLVDRNYFRAAISNLVTNAIDACEPKGGGHVWIEAGRARGALGISVVDTGVGVSESNKPRLFRAYFTTKTKGTGMGLALTRRIIEEHGGFLAFDSVEGQGSRFMIMLPLSSGDSMSQLVVSGANPLRVNPDVQEHEAEQIIDISNAFDEVLEESRKSAKSSIEIDVSKSEGKSS